MADDLPPGFPPCYSLSGDLNHSKTYELLMKEAANLVREKANQEPWRLSPPRISPVRTNRTRVRQLKYAASFLRKDTMPVSRTRTRKASRALAAPKNAPQPGKAREADNRGHLLATSLVANAPRESATLSPKPASGANTQQQPGGMLYTEGQDHVRTRRAGERDKQPRVSPATASPPWKHTAPPSCYPADPPADSSPEETRLAGSPLPSFPAAADVTRSPQKNAASSLGTAKTAAATLGHTSATSDTME
ncbi:hypothetical protein HPB52_021306 [Rhipicephalus sanguineus]|uniref:Uncharacterized protein n=1 Tax=Rhipicephalus sanguineus TaxID=34632 RepID=A0A9D4PEN6_RHISA|nr:hypothetical protein HPB52_021306 [Rhipicephalus sanguineus]